MLGKSWVFTYDTAGNILSKKEYAYTTGTLGEVLDTKTYTYAATGWKDRLTSFNGEAIAYDALGNPTTYRGHALTWGKIRQLESYRIDSGTLLTFAYDASGSRIRKGATTYQLDGSKILSETRSTGTVRYYYDNGGVCGFQYNGAKYYYEKNLQGDITAIYDESGSLKATYEYDAWGNHTITVNVDGIATLNPFRYRGYYYDAETNLYYLNSRYYDSQTGRFINADDIDVFCVNQNSILQYNVFTYCLNDPINRLDSNGDISWKKLFGWGVTVALIGLAALAAIPTGGGSLVIAGVGISAATATNAAIAVVGIGGIMTVSGFLTGVVEGISYSIGNNHGKTKGQDFRGGSKKTRDKWYGHDDRGFQKWFERQGKKYYNDGLDIADKMNADELYEIWKSLGSPFPK